MSLKGFGAEGLFQCKFFCGHSRYPWSSLPSPSWPVDLIPQTLWAEPLCFLHGHGGNQSQPRPSEGEVARGHQEKLYLVKTGWFSLAEVKIGEIWCSVLRWSFYTVLLWCHCGKIAPCQTEDGFGLTNDIQSDRLSFAEKLLPHTFPLLGRKESWCVPCWTLRSTLKDFGLPYIPSSPQGLWIPSILLGLRVFRTPHPWLLSLKCTTVHSIRRI